MKRDAVAFSCFDEAVATGRSIPAIAIERARAGAGGASVAAAAWRQMPRRMRECLLAFCTDRPPMRPWEEVSWHSLTENERTNIGSTARLWRRELDRAAGLLR